MAGFAFLYELKTFNEVALNKGISTIWKENFLVYLNVLESRYYINTTNQALRA